MKNLVVFAIAALLIGCSSVFSSAVAQTQSVREMYKQRATKNKYDKKMVNERASRQARKETKKFEKDGWQVNPGALPLAKQLDRSYKMQEDLDDDFIPKYLVANAQSIGENYDAAHAQALSIAKENLAGLIQTEVTAIIENTIANEQLSAEEAASVVRTVSASKNLIAQSLGRVLNVVECYRTVKNGNKEVLVYIAYNYKTAVNETKKVVRKELEKQGEKLHEQLDKSLGFAE